MHDHIQLSIDSGCLEFNIFHLALFSDAVVLDIQDGRIIKHTCYQKHKSVRCKYMYSK